MDITNTAQRDCDNPRKTHSTFIDILTLLLLLENALYRVMEDRMKRRVFHERLPLQSARLGQVAEEDNPSGQGENPDDIPDQCPSGTLPPTLKLFVSHTSGAAINVTTPITWKQSMNASKCVCAPSSL